MKKTILFLVLSFSISPLIAQKGNVEKFAFARFNEFIKNDRKAFVSHFASNQQYKEILVRWNKREKKQEFDTNKVETLRAQSISILEKSFDKNYKNFGSQFKKPTIDSFQVKWEDYFTEEDIIVCSIYTASIFFKANGKRYKFKLFCPSTIDNFEFFLIGGFLKIPVKVRGIDFYNRGPNVLIEELDRPIIRFSNEVTISAPDRKPKIVEAPKQPSNDSTIYTAVEQMAEFPGGEDAMLKFIISNINYPEKASSVGISGIVYIQFVVNKNGSLTQHKIARDIGAGCGEEALRVIKKMPKWKPAKNNGQSVRSSFILPIQFLLPE